MRKLINTNYGEGKKQVLPEMEKFFFVWQKSQKEDNEWRAFSELLVKRCLAKTRASGGSLLITKINTIV